MPVNGSARSEQAVVAHACHGQRYLHRFLCPGQEKKGGSKGISPALAGTREYKQSDRNQ